LQISLSRIEQSTTCIAHLAQLGPVHADVVQVGVFFKCDTKLAELRPKAHWISLEVILPQPIEDRRIARRIRLSEARTVHVIKLRSVEDVDDGVRNWLTEAFLFATRKSSSLRHSPFCQSE
jgi:hypothetical protein